MKGLCPYHCIAFLPSQAGCKIKSVRVKDKELAEDKIPTEEGVKKKPNRYQATLSVPLEFPAPSRKRGPS